MLKKIFFASIFVFITLEPIKAQESSIYRSAQEQYSKAMGFYMHKQYVASRYEFEDIIKRDNEGAESLKEGAEYFASLCSMKLKEENSEGKMKEFIKNHPSSIRKTQAMKTIAYYYFDKEEYESSLEWLDSIKIYHIHDANGERETFIFKKSYSQYILEDYSKAKLGFSKIFSSTDYGTEAKYYYAHIAYIQDNNETALKYFKEVSKDIRYKNQVPFFKSQIYFNQKKYSKAIDEATKPLEDKESEQFSDLSKLVGESYFNLEKYEEALPHLLAYKGEKGKFDNTHLYQIGYAYFQIKKYDKAISYFNKIINKNSEIAQNAYYNLAACYLKLDKKSESLNAFRSASDMNYNKKIKEDALYNYARLSYEVGNVAESVLMALNRYIKTYPNSYHRREIYSLVVESYLSSNNYEEVIRVLDSTGLDSYKMKVVYQKASYLQGIQYYNDEKFGEAKNMFEISINGGYDKEYRAKAKYWMAECDYMLGRYGDALIGYKAYRLEDASADTYEYKMLPYSLGYAQFKLKKYADASKEFLLFSQREIEDENMINDNYLRLGDSYFMDKKYWKALESYNNSLKTSSEEEDYAIYQKAVCYGLMGRNDTRIKTIEMFMQKFPNSDLGDDALYLLANSYIGNGETEKALKTYENLETAYPNSTYIPKAKLKNALIYYNKNDSEKALEEYKLIVSKYPSTSEAKQAVAGSRKIYIDMGEASTYVEWVKTLDFIDISQAEADSTSYLAGEGAFMKGNCQQTILSFREYLNDFPKGISRLNAHFYLAECEYKSGQYHEALNNYIAVVEKDKNEFTEHSLVRTSELYMKKKDTINALKSFVSLFDVSENKQNKVYSSINLMRIYNSMNNIEEALSFAVILENNDKVSDRVRSEALLIIARNAMKNEDEAFAKATYKKLLGVAKGKMKVEAMYYKAYFLNEASNYEKSNEIIFDIASKHAGYKYWGAKSLLIMAENFNALNDKYQATYTLETIIKNFDFEDLKIKAEELLNEINTKNETAMEDETATEDSISVPDSEMEFAE